MNKQTALRIWRSFRLYTILSSGKRADYLRRHQVFHHLGEKCTIVERKIPLCPRLVSIGNNVHLATGVLLVPHDAIHLCLNHLEESEREKIHFKEKIGCIEIGDNVFVGANSIVLYDVRIGSRVIIGAGSLVNKDIPDNSVAVGVPARVVGTFDDFVKKRKASEQNINEYVNHDISPQLEASCWERHMRKDSKEGE